MGHGTYCRLRTGPRRSIHGLAFVLLCTVLGSAIAEPRLENAAGQKVIGSEVTLGGSISDGQNGSMLRGRVVTSSLPSIGAANGSMLRSSLKLRPVGPSSSEPGGLSISERASDYLLGKSDDGAGLDVNGDGKVDVADIVAAQRLLAQ